MITRCYDLGRSPNFLHSGAHIQTTITGLTMGTWHPSPHQRGHGAPPGRPQPVRSRFKAIWGSRRRRSPTAEIGNRTRRSRGARSASPWAAPATRRAPRTPPTPVDAPPPSAAVRTTAPPPRTAVAPRAGTGHGHVQPHRRDRGGREARHIGCDCQANGSGSVIYQEDVRLGRRGGGVDEP